MQIVHRMSEAHKSMCHVFHIFSDTITSPITKRKRIQNISFEPWMGVCFTKPHVEMLWAKKVWAYLFTGL